MKLRCYIMLLLGWPLVASVRGQTDTTHDGIRSELELIHRLDQADRKVLGAYPKGVERDSIVKHLMVQDSLNLMRIEAIIDSVGWLGPDQVGTYAASTFFLVVQHADRWPTRQAALLPVLSEAVRGGRAAKQQLAMLTDRIAMNQGRPQRFGTQVRLDRPQPYFWPIEDPGNVDVRRWEMGMGPLAEYAERMGVPWSTAIGASTEDLGPCTCSSQLSSLIEKVEKVYIGFHLNDLNGDTAGYAEAVSALRHRSHGSSIEACWSVLREYVDLHKDGHLFISDSWIAPDTTIRKPTAPQTPTIDATKARSWLDSLGADRHAIEGIWIAHDGQQVLIRRTNDPLPGKYLAEPIRDTRRHNGQERAVAMFSSLERGGFEVTVFDTLGVAQNPGIYTRTGSSNRISRTDLLLIPPYQWHRTYPGDSRDECRIDPIHPMAPLMFPLSGRSRYWCISLPSCDPAYTVRLDSLLHIHRRALEKARVIIVDLRGNIGGSSAIPDGISRLFEPKAQQPGVEQSKAVVLSSDDTRQYFEYVSADGWVPKGLTDRMVQGTGRIVSFSDSVVGQPSGDMHDTGLIQKRPKRERPRIAVIVDEQTMSAAEVFCTKARSHANVHIYGQPTAGCIDYQNVNMVRFGCKEAGYLLGYPLMATTFKLPIGGHNLTGVVPDVVLETEMHDLYARVVALTEGTRKRPKH